MITGKSFPVNHVCVSASASGAFWLPAPNSCCLTLPLSDSGVCRFIFIGAGRINWISSVVHILLLILSAHILLSTHHLPWRTNKYRPHYRVVHIHTFSLPQSSLRPVEALDWYLLISPLHPSLFPFLGLSPFPPPPRALGVKYSEVTSTLLDIHHIHDHLPNTWTCWSILQCRI